MSEPYLSTPDVVLFQGDCLEVLRTLADASVDAVVTDPPAGIAFMAKTWDTDKGGRDAWIAWLTSVMAEAHRVLKPGGHALVWALPRTSHWTATALENAGFTIRDCVVHLFGSGFPKSLDVGKAIDRAAGVEREVVGTKLGLPGYSTRNGIGSNANLTDDGWKGVGAEHGGMAVTAPATPDAQRWDGWGTSLKPGAEHWWLVRKPFPGTVAANVLTHGVGGINVDACRVGEGTGADAPEYVPNRKNAVYGNGLGGGAWENTAGRWPTNLVLTHSAACPEGGPCSGDCPAGELDSQSGTRRASAATAHSTAARPDQVAKGAEAARHHVKGRGDEGGASRFYPTFRPTFRYQAKAPARERPKVNGVSHPTTKSLGLMSWLCRMITPPGGVVLDMFAGSGATLQAALTEGFRAIGIEAEETYLPLIMARLAPFLDDDHMQERDA